MFKLIQKLGKVVVSMYNAEARRLHTLAKKEAKLAQKLAKQVQELSEKSIANTNDSAKVAAQAIELSKFFK
ncbi:hypothetical protein pEp_SNUABM04_00033 [Erwinia phage pEp_SNUABM_04]|nr:hypothetical protein pEp_SNUABM04_00033 [Erwinia phage pEp_SNUABM_04]